MKLPMLLQLIGLALAGAPRYRRSVAKRSDAAMLLPIVRLAVTRPLIQGGFSAGSNTTSALGIVR